MKLALRLILRVASALLTVVLAVALAFILSNISGDPVRQSLGPLAPQSQVDAIRHDLGYDRPLLLRMLSSLADLARLDFGHSMRYGVSNISLIGSRALSTVELALTALLIAVIIGSILGLIAALKAGGIVDRAIEVTALVGLSAPVFWVGLVLILVFSVSLRIFPAGGAGDFGHLILPALTLSIFMSAQIARLLRASLIEVLHEPYITLARAHGTSPVRIALVHAFRSASLPVVTLVGLQIGMLVSSTVTVEFIFSRPGVGSLLLDAVLARDSELVQAIVVVGVIVFVVTNLAVDLLYTALDPRLRGSTSHKESK